MCCWRLAYVKLLALPMFACNIDSFKICLHIIDRYIAYISTCRIASEDAHNRPQYESICKDANN